jgi:hypothetical protein
VVATLPFMWSEDMSCDAQPKPLVSGLAILFGKQLDNPVPGLIFGGLLVTCVGLGFLVTRTRRPWRRLAGQVVAGLAALGTTLMCAMMFTHGRPEQPHDHPAAWIGTLSALALAFEAWWGSGEALRRAQEHRRARKAEVARIAGSGAGPLRIAESLADESHQDEDEDDGELEDDAPRPARKRVP